MLTEKVGSILTFFNSRWLIPAAILWNFHAAFATDYYVSTQGNDANKGTSPATAWKTLGQVAKSKALFKPGDRILLERGGRFYEALSLDNIKGTAAAPLVIGAYGSGNQPVLSGAITVSNWQQQGNIWKATCTNCPASLNAVYMAGEILPIGRFPNLDAPNKGYLSIDQSHGFNDNKVLVDQELGSAFPSNYWRGGEVVVRTRRWLLDRAEIASHIGGTISLNNRLTYGALKDFGYFIQNHYNTLDQHKEWYYNKATKELFLYLENVNPNQQQVEVAAIPTVLSVSNAEYITIQDITFEKAHAATVNISQCHNCVLSNNRILNSAQNGLVMNNSNQATINDNVVQYSLSNSFIFAGNNARIFNNEISHTALIAGMGTSGNGQHSGTNMRGNNNLFEYNTVRHSGYNGIHFISGPWNIRYNLVEYFCITKDDGAGIYTYGNTVGNTISNNIVLYAVGAPEGTENPGHRSERGLYADGGSSNIVYDKNTIAYGGENMLIHVSNNITLTNNTFVGSTSNTLRINQSTDNGTTHADIRNLSVKNNTFVSTQDTYPVYSVLTFKNDMELFGLIDDNTLCQPFQSVSPASPYMLNMEQNTAFPNGFNYDRRYMTFTDLAKSIYGSKDKTAAVPAMAYPRYKVNNTVGNNLLKNSSMEATFYDNTNWLAETNNSSSYTVRPITNGGIEGLTLRAQFTSTDPNLYGRVLQKNLRWTYGRYYRLTFDVKGSSPSKVVIKAVTDQGDEIHAIRPVDVSEAVTRYQFIFQAKSTTDKGRLVFEMTSASGTVLYDNVQMHEVEVQEARQEDVVRLEYNASKSAREVTLRGTYYTPDGTKAPSKITLAPYQSIVLIKDLSAPQEEENTSAPAPVTKGTLPWSEDFDLADGTIIDKGTTAWNIQSTQQAGDVYGVEQGMFRFSKAASAVVWTSQPIDISGVALARIRFDLKEVGELEKDGEAADFLNAYYKVDQGKLQPIQLQSGNLPADDTWYTFRADSIAGKVLQLIIHGKTTVAAESYYIDNILVELDNGQPEDETDGTVDNGEEKPDTGHGEEEPEVNTPETPGQEPEENTPGEEVRLGSVIRIYAAGKTGREAMVLYINENPVMEWTQIAGDFEQRTFVQYSYTHTVSISDPSNIKIAYIDEEEGAFALKVDKIIVDGRIYETEAPSTYSTGTNVGSGCYPGYKQDERLQCSGYFHYAVGHEVITGIDNEPGITPGEIEMVVYPNPVRNNLYVRTDGSIQGHVQLKLTDLSGRVIHEREIHTSGQAVHMDMSTLKAGMYMIQVQDEQRNFKAYKVIKK